MTTVPYVRLTERSSARTAGRKVGVARVGLLLTGFAIAVAARVAVGGVGPGRSPGAGLLFAALLAALAAAAGTRVPMTLRAMGWGLGGAVLLSVPVALLRFGSPLHASPGFASWALVIAIVATAEEVFLRGTLYDAVRGAFDERAAIVVAAIAFAALHIPLYGWHVVPLDLVVGLVLGELRRASGTPAAPAVTHVVADVAAWFLR